MKSFILRDRNLTILPPNLPKHVGFFDCSENNLTSLDGAPVTVDDDFDCSNNQLPSLVGSPSKVKSSYFCNENNLTSLVGAPKKVQSFKCSDNFLVNLIGAPEYVGTSPNSYAFNCDFNMLTSLLGIPKNINGRFFCVNNKELKDFSDLWNSSITGMFKTSLNNDMAILPLVKFDTFLITHVGLTDKEELVINEILRTHRGDSKQNIIDCQYALIENDLAEYAKWKP